MVAAVSLLAAPAYAEQCRDAAGKFTKCAGAEVTTPTKATVFKKVTTPAKVAPSEKIATPAKTSMAKTTASTSATLFKPASKKASCRDAKGHFTKCAA